MGTYALFMDLTPASEGAWVPSTPSTGINRVLNPPGDSSIRFQVTGNNWELDNSGTYLAFSGLPAGFTPTTAFVQVGNNIHSVGDQGAQQFGTILSEGPFETGTAGHQSCLAWEVVPAPTALVLNNTGCGFHGIATITSIWVAAAGVPGNVKIFGAYVLQQWWVSGDDYVFGADPGGGATPVDAPTPRIDSIVPNSGPTSGGTSVTITGAGFWNPDGTVGVESVLFDGEFPGTSVVVSDEHTLTCVTPAHWKGTKDVVVVLDFAP